VRLTLWMCCLLAVGTICIADQVEPAAPSEELLDALANKPYRASWAPLPMLRGHAARTSLLHKLLQSPDAKARVRSAFLLGQIGSGDSAALLATRLQDPERSVRVQSGIALACMGDARGITVCSAVLGDAPSWIRYYAVYGLWCVNTPAARRALQRHTRDRDALVSRTIREALKTPYIAPPVPPPRSDIKPSADMPPDEAWDEACDLFITESDWWWHRGDYDQCIRCLEAAVFLDPRYIDGYTSIAWLEWSLGRDPAAIRTLNCAISACPSDPEAYYGLGFHYYRTKRYARAEKPLNRAVELGGDHRTRRTYAHCLERLGKLDKALEQWSAVLALCPEDAAAEQNSARVKNLIQQAK